MNGAKKAGIELKNGITRFLRAVKGRIFTIYEGIRSAVCSCTAVKYLMRAETSDCIKRCAKCIGLCITGFLFGICRVEYMAYPLGFAFLIASGKLSFFVYMGSAIASLTYPQLGFAFFGVNTLIYIIRKLLLSDNFSESRHSRIILAFLSALFISCALLLSASSGTYTSVSDGSDLFSCCFSYVTGMPLAVLMFYPVTSNERFTASGAKISLVFFCICLIMSTSFLPLGYLPLFAASICTLFFCTFFDGYSGVPAGALFGLATTDLIFCAPLCVAAFLFVYLHRKCQLLIYPMFCLCVAVVSVFAGKADDFLAILICEALAVILFMPFGLVISSRRLQTENGICVHRDALCEAYNGRMSALSGAFGAVSKLCFAFSNRTRFPNEDEVQVFISVHCAKVCSECSLGSECRKKQLWCDRSFASGLISGKLTASSIPERLSGACPMAQSICDALNKEYKKLISDRFNNNKTEILAREYAAMGRILKYTARVSSEDTAFDSRLTSLACGASEKLGIINTGTAVYGQRKKTLDICGVPVSCVSMPSDEIATFYSGQCSELFDSPEFILDEDGTFTVRMKSKELICTEHVSASHTKDGETVSGDSVSFFKSDDSYFYALIADGMGSGRDAAMTSRLTSVFVEKLLSGGAGKGVTIELLNNLLMSKNKECFSGVDLLEIDLIKKKASFVKAGAAPAYLLRSTKLFKVSSDTPPCGIIEGYCAENTSFDIFSGDIIIMLSDGITSSIDCGTALCDIMNSSKDCPAQVLAGKILDMAVSLSVHDDDMSCVIIKIK